MSERFMLSVTIISRDEEADIARAIESVCWADDIVVVDSGSTDRTVEIARGLGARVFTNAWPGYGQQKNFAARQAKHNWILNIDADECVPPELAEEIRAKVGEGGVSGFRLPRKTFYLGHWIRHGGWYPNYLVRLADRRRASWSEPEVHEELRVEGEIGTLDHPLHHEAFPSIREQVLTNLRYAELGSRNLRKAGCRPSVLKLWLKPIGKFLECFILKRGFLDGVPGFIISFNAAHSIFMKYAFLLEPELRKEK